MSAWVAGKWSVVRWSGRRMEKPRIVLATDDASAAYERYHNIAVVLRQGRVLLIGPDGAVVQHAHGPNLRTRW